MELTYTTHDTPFNGKIKVIEVKLTTTGDELADLKRAANAATEADTSARWFGNDYQAEGGTAVFHFEVR